MVNNCFKIYYIKYDRKKFLLINIQIKKGNLRMTTILLLEDDAALRIGLSYDLEAEGYNLIVAETIEEGRAVVANNNIDLAILDVDLPDGNGFDFCIEIKNLKSMLKTEIAKEKGEYTSNFCNSM